MDLTVPRGMGGKKTNRQLLDIIPASKQSFRANSNDPIMAGFRAYGFQGVVAKPLRMKELSEMVHKFFDGMHSS